MHKEKLVALLALLLLANLGGCGGKGASVGEAESLVEAASASEPSGMPESGEPLAGETLPEEEAASGWDALEEELEAAAGAEPVSVKEQVIFDQEGIRITILGLEEGDLVEDGLRLLIENAKDQAVIVQCPELSVNGFQVGNSFSARLGAGKKQNAELRFSSFDLAEAGIRKAGLIEAVFAVYDPDNWKELVSSGELSIQTSAFGEEEADIDPGQLVFDEGQVRISVRYVAEDPAWGGGFLLFLENEGPERVFVEARDLSIDDFMLEGASGVMLGAGKKSVEHFYVLMDELAENGIVDPKEAELTFEVSAADTLEPIAEGTRSFPL